MSKVTQVCPECNNSFSYFPNKHQNRTYCSRACQMKAKRVETVCPSCGQGFWYHVSWPRVYCSRQCSASVNAKTNLGIVELGPQFCDQCGSEIQKTKKLAEGFVLSSALAFGRVQTFAELTTHPSLALKEHASSADNPFMWPLTKSNKAGVSFAAYIARLFGKKNIRHKTSSRS